MVWSAGRYIPENLMDVIAGKVGSLPPLVEGFVGARAGRGPQFPKFTSSLPLDLELELQSL